MKTNYISAILLATLVGVTTTLICGCAPSMSPNTYKATEVGQASHTVQAKVVSMRPITIDANTGIGGLVGTAAGAVAGSAIGGDTTTNIIGGIGGAVVGGLAGNALENGMSQKNGIEYVMKTNKGTLVTVTQTEDLHLRVGQRVLIIYGQQVRVVPDTSR